MAPRLILALAGLAFIGFGVAFLVSPEPMARFVDLELVTPTALTEVRAMYGGLEIGLGVFLLTALGRRDHVAMGLRVALFAFAGLALGRLVGLVVDSPWQPVMWLLTAAEVTAAALAGWAMQTMRTSHHATEPQAPDTVKR
jgi:uncharacterized membrane protein